MRSIIIVFYLSNLLITTQCQSRFNSDKNRINLWQNIVEKLGNNNVDFMQNLESELDSLSAKKVKLLCSPYPKKYRATSINNIVVFNDQKTKFITSINIRGRLARGSDLILMIYGIIQNKKPIPLVGSTYYIPVGYYKCGYEPFTEQEMNFIAFDNVLKRYFSYNKGNNSIRFNNDLFENKFPIPYTKSDSLSIDEIFIKKYKEYTSDLYENLPPIDSVYYEERISIFKNHNPKKDCSKEKIFDRSEWKKINQ